MDDTPQWVRAMWAELDAMPALDRVAAAAAWTTLMTNDLLAELGEARRLAVVEYLVPRGGAKAIPALAETLGTRPNVIQRLWEEGRKLWKIHNP